tara:strand:- start:246 stop:701 length:456 start_codon:yes stop_codon:yes gene_type:complete
MNLYVNIININNLNNNNCFLNDLDTYKFKTNNISFIFTENFILQNINNRIYKIKIIDEDIKYTKCENYNIISDKSKFIKEEEFYQLPYNYIIFNTKKIYYQLRENAIVNLVIELNENQDIVSCFFYTKEKLITNSMIEDINSFLSLLKIKQ